MDIRFEDQLPGTTWTHVPPDGSLRISGRIDSLRPLIAVEVVKNGDVITRIEEPVHERTRFGTARTSIDAVVPVTGSAWLAVRCSEQVSEDAPADKVIFAHTNPVFVDVASRPLLPKRHEVEFFIARMDAEIERNTEVLNDEALQEFREAKAIYQELLQRAQ